MVLTFSYALYMYIPNEIFDLITVLVTRDVTKTLKNSNRTIDRTYISNNNNNVEIYQQISKRIV